MEASTKRAWCNEEKPAKKLCLQADDNVIEPKPKIKKINEVLAVELLETIIQALPVKLFLKRGRTDELQEILITRQFQLRYLCRLWRNIVLRNAKLAVALQLPDSDRSSSEISVLPAGFRFETADGLFSALKSSADRTLFASDLKWLDCITKLRLSLCDDEIDNEESVVSLLFRLTQLLQQPVRLSLALSEAHLSGSIKHDFQTSFPEQFPNLTLIELELDKCIYYCDEPEPFSHAARLTEHYLEFGLRSLVKLDVNLFILDQAASWLSMRSNGDDVAGQWSCTTLRQLRLYVYPLGENFYDYDDVESRDATYAIEAKLPGWFPSLKELLLNWPETDENRVQFDFTILKNFPKLARLTLSNDFLGDHMRVDCRVERLLNIETFSCSAFGTLPLDLALLVPKVSVLVVSRLHWRFVNNLAAQLITDPTPFEKLNSLMLDFRLPNVDWAAKLGHVMLFLLALQVLQSLTTLEMEHLCAQCPSGDLSLLDVIPKGLIKLRLDCCLKPNGVRLDKNHGKWYFQPKRASRLDIKTVYQDWIKALLRRVCSFPALKEFSCVVPVPKFKTVRSLMTEWSRNPVEFLTFFDTDFAAKNVKFDLAEPAQSVDISIDLIITSKPTPISVKIVFKNAKHYSLCIPF